jgi:hypothetical protein
MVICLIWLEHASWCLMSLPDYKHGGFYDMARMELFLWVCFMLIFWDFYGFLTWFLLAMRCGTLSFMDRVTLPTNIFHCELVVIFFLTVHPPYFLFSFTLPCVTHRKPDYGGRYVTGWMPRTRPASSGITWYPIPDRLLSCYVVTYTRNYVNTRNNVKDPLSTYCMMMYVSSSSHRTKC